jgi:hypothetical protein
MLKAFRTADKKIPKNYEFISQVPRPQCGQFSTNPKRQLNNCYQIARSFYD